MEHVHFLACGGKKSSKGGKKRLAAWTWIVVCMVMCVIVISSCAHNNTFGGIGTDIGVGNAQFGEIRFRNGAFLGDVSRENTIVDIEINDEAGLSYDQAQNTVKGLRRVSIRRGPQITGYLKELAEVSPETATEYVKAAAEFFKDKKSDEDISGDDDVPAIQLPQIPEIPKFDEKKEEEKSLDADISPEIQESENPEEKK